MFGQNKKQEAIKRKMKLAEGLLLRADLKKKIEHLQNRIRPVLIVYDGKIPQEDAIKLMAQLRKAIQDLEKIIVRINKTNNQTSITGEGSLMEALAKRDSLKMLTEKLRVIQQASRIQNTNYNSMKTTIDFKKLQIEIDQTGRKFRELDNKIQETNWLTELKE